MNDNRKLIGHIVRLQVQTAHLKCGEKPHRWYDPAPIAVVPELILDRHGVRGVREDGTILEDVHNETHEVSRFRGDNGISVVFTGHYRAMRERFGGHLEDGIAGENILIASDDVHNTTTLGGSLLAATSKGDLRIDDIHVADPCVEFSTYCLRLPHGQRPDRSVTEALQFLRNGMRGFYASVQDSGSVRTGDPVYRVRSFADA